MTIIFGAADYGQYIRRFFFESCKDVVFYDNDRRKWGRDIDGITVISFEQFMKELHNHGTKIIIGVKNKTALFFLKDVCISENEIFAVDGEQLVRFDLESIGDFERNIKEIEEEKMKRYEEARDAYALEGNMEAYRHAVQYIEFKKNNPLTPEIGGIELTNNCNLSCPNCPNPTSKRPRGFMSEEVFQQAVKMIPPIPCQGFSVHGLGEPLLHPQFIPFLEQLAALNVHIDCSTNGILLGQECAKRLFAVFDKTQNATLYVSFHSKKSVENWFHCIQMAEERKHVHFYGQVLEHNVEQAEKWLAEIGIDKPRSHPYIRYISSHSFAGHVEGRRKEYSGIELTNRIRNCTYLKNNKVTVAWDGVLKMCCFDTETTGECCGTIMKMEKAKTLPFGNELCRNCDPDWTSGWQ